MAPVVHIHGRVFRRLKQFYALCTELKDEAALLEAHLAKVQDDVFTKHHTLKLKVVRAVRYKRLLEVVDEWIVARIEHAALAAPPAVIHEDVAPPHTSPASSNDAFVEDFPPTNEEEAEAKQAAIEATRRERLTYAQQLVNALVLKGFIAPYKENKITDPLDFEALEEFDFKDSELLVPLAKAVARPRSPNATVWALVDGVLFAELLKRRAGLLAPLTHGKDTYVVVNARVRSLTLFKSDVAREPIRVFQAAMTSFTLDKSHDENGVKIWDETDSELLSPSSAAERDALVAALKAVGGMFEEEFPIMDHHTKPANYSTAPTYTIEELEAAASNALPREDSPGKPNDEADAASTQSETSVDVDEKRRRPGGPTDDTLKEGSERARAPQNGKPRGNSSESRSTISDASDCSSAGPEPVDASAKIHPHAASDRALDRAQHGFESSSDSKGPFEPNTADNHAARDAPTPAP